MNGPQELDLRLLRAFVAVAEELHFTRAASRLFVAQQALSRDIRRLESHLGTPLFNRTTRHVTLTADGERLLARARALLALNDAAVAELRGATRPLLVDVVGEGLTAARVVEAARAAAPELEFTMRYGGGMGTSLPQLLAGRLDVAFGRPEGGGGPLPADLTRRLVRYEPLALLVPEEHPLAVLPEIPCERLRGVEIDISAGNEAAPEWVDLGMAFVQAFGALASPPHPHVIGVGETARHLRAHGLPILTMSERPPVAGGVLRGLVAPVPFYAWAMVHRTDATHSGLATLRSTVEGLAAAEGWRDLPLDHWLAAGDTGWARAG